MLGFLAIVREKINVSGSGARTAANLLQGFIRMKILLFLRKLPVTFGLVSTVIILNFVLLSLQFTAISNSQKLMTQTITGNGYLANLCSALERIKSADSGDGITSGDRSLVSSERNHPFRTDKELEVTTDNFQQLQKLQVVLQNSQLKSHQNLQISFASFAIATSLHIGLIVLILHHLRLIWANRQNSQSDRHQELPIQKAQNLLLEMTTDAMFIHNPQQQISYWNRAAEKLYGWKSSAVLGGNVKDILYREDIQTTNQAMTAVETTGYWQGEIRQIHRDGNGIIVNSRWQGLYDERGRLQSVLVVNQNITEQRTLEGMMLRSQRLEMIGTLAGGVAHDLNNILSPILLSIQLLEMKLRDGEYQKILKTLETNVKRGANLVKQVLSVARGNECKHTCIDMYVLLADIEEFINETFPKLIGFNSYIAPNLAYVFGNNNQLYQVLLNLVVNARDAMPDGGKIELSAQMVEIINGVESGRENHPQTLKPGAYIVISVCDTGFGMTPQIRDRIFEPFFTTKQTGKGTGLGLYTAQMIIQNHDGTIQVTTNPDRGTNFQVYLPAYKSVGC